MDGTCFRRLMIKVAEPRRQLELFLSPDQRFLTESLLDTRIDPSLERRRFAQETQKRLLQDDSPSVGPKDAAVTLVVFSDFQCPYCKRFADLLAAIPADERANLRVVYKQRPLVMHPWARPAALASICASFQGGAAFWSLYDWFAANQSTLTAENLEAKVGAFASQGGRIKADDLHACLAEHSAEKVLERDELLAEKYHVEATPTVFINGIRRGGFGSLEELESAIRLARVHAAEAANDAESEAP